MIWDASVYINSLFFLCLLGYSIFAPPLFFYVGWWTHRVEGDWKRRS